MNPAGPLSEQGSGTARRAARGSTRRTTANGPSPQRIPATHRYQVTSSTGLHTAMILTRIHDRVLPTGLAQVTGTTGPPGRLRTAATAYQDAIDDLIRDAGLAARCLRNDF